MPPVGIQWQLVWGEIRNKEFGDNLYLWLVESKLAWIYKMQNGEILGGILTAKLTDSSELIDLRNEKD